MNLPRYSQFKGILFACLITILTLPDAINAKQSEDNHLPAKKITEVEGITEYQLSNGIKAILFPDESKPEFTFNVTVKVGSRHEGYGETGMAHLLEHMLFKGTDLHPDIPKILKDRGVLYMQGTTWLDRTNYYETLPAKNDNLEFAIRMEADRLLNSWVKGEDLISEMTVVRNEFESRENSPQQVLYERIMSAAYQWHNYGKSTIGNRTDIERVPIERLRKFYKKHYQPDNISLILAGKFEAENALRLLEQHFGEMKLPERELDKTYTEEPSQDGERVVTLRRVGETPVIGVGYHVPSAGHPQYAACDVLSNLLGMQPAGPIYESLVLSGEASSVSSRIQPAFDPGMMLVFADLPKGSSIEEVQKKLVAEIEKIGEDGIDESFVKRAIEKVLKRREQTLADIQQVAIDLSDWESYGDWRLYFLHRDRIKNVTAADVQEAAKLFCTRSNRTVGIYRPSTEIARTKIPGKPDLAKALDGYSGGKKMVSGESFDASPANIKTRTKIGKLKSGIETAFLNKSTRGDQVFMSAEIHYGSAESLEGMQTACMLLGPMMSRGTSSLDYKGLQDKLNELGSTLFIGGQPGNLSITIQSKKKHFFETLSLLKETLRSPSFAVSEFEVLKKLQLTQLQSTKTEPQALASTGLMRRISDYSKGDIRYIPTIEESIQMLESCQVDHVQKVYELLGGHHGELAIVGDLDFTETEKQLDDIFGDWESSIEFKRIENDLPDSFDTTRISIDTPDKANAFYLAGIPMAMNQNHPDYEALLIGNFIFGGGGLSSRLADRVRKKEGLSYGVGSQVTISPRDQVGVLMIYAISNPGNTEKVVNTVNEEIEKMIEGGISSDELEKAISSYLEQRQAGRTSNNGLTVMLRKILKDDLTFEFIQARDDKISNLSKEHVEAAMKSVLGSERLIVATAGDFEKSKGNEDKSSGN